VLCPDCAAAHQAEEQAGHRHSIDTAAPPQYQAATRQSSSGCWFKVFIFLIILTIVAAVGIWFALSKALDKVPGMLKTIQQSLPPSQANPATQQQSQPEALQPEPVSVTENTPTPSDSKALGLSAVSGSVQLEFKEVRSWWNPDKDALVVALFREAPKDTTLAKLRKGVDLAGKADAPDLLLSFNFNPGIRRCSVYELRYYSVTFFRKRNGFKFAGELDSLQFVRTGTWQRSQELAGFKCELKPGGSAVLILEGQAVQRAPSGEINFSWNLGIDTKLMAE
jgi:hypothetical protein